jgi:hypothetical protein
MGIVTKFRCDVCGAESETGQGYLELFQIAVREASRQVGKGKIVVDTGDDTPAPLVCGQECYHKWHAAKLAQHFDPVRHEDIEVLATREAGYGQVVIEGAAVGVVDS